MTHDTRFATVDARLTTALTALTTHPPSEPVQLIDVSRAARQVATFRDALPRVRLYYAYKCAPRLPLVDAIDGEVDGYDIASVAELRELTRHGVSPARMIFSHPVKREAHIREAYDAGIRVFVYQSTDELDKLERAAPGAHLMLRLDVGDGDRTRHKFGASPHDARQLLQEAGARGLLPIGITFHVGTQTADPARWRDAIITAGRVAADARAHGIALTTIDIGGGFPVDYVHGTDTPFRTVADTVRAALEELPSDIDIIAEPGRFIAADTACLITTVVGCDNRAGQPWIYLDTGIFHGMAEAWEFGRLLPRIYPLYPALDTTPPLTCTLAGPTCDDLDVIASSYLLPITPRSGDVLVMAQTGAYVDTYATVFNGLAAPATHYVAK